MDNSDVFLTGDKVRLRAFREEDQDAAYSYLSQPELDGRRYLPWKLPNSGPLTQASIKVCLEDWSERDKKMVAAITPAGEDRVIGHVGGSWKWDPLLSSVWLVVDPREQRKGFGSEALQLMLGYIYENLPANNISLWVSDWNEAGLAFGRSQGFKECGVMRRAGLRDGAFYGEVVMDLLRREWIKMEKEAHDGA
ncbi:MAG: GNAT family N-acetyltransferase [Anaerolineae bacterium]|nr:GNAT family N-acetyltransferase [Anaerolineae bacterium]